MDLRPIRRWWAGSTPGVRGLVLACVAVHLGLAILHAIDPEYGNLAFDRMVLVPSRLPWPQPWGLVTALVVHDPDGILHLLFNMLALWWLGPWVERSLRTRRFLLLFLACGVTGSLAQSGWGFVTGTEDVPILGASGGILGLVVSFGLLYPDAMLKLWLFAPLKAKHLVWLLLGVDAILLVGTDVAVAAHLGGILCGWLWIKRPWRRLWLRARAWRIRRRMDRL
jgi:membrane associated rhomboid family serine protease